MLGEIDLDPASHVLAQPTVRAKTFFTAADNGLEQPWFGRVWLNPPYGRTLLQPFVDKLMSEYASGAVSQAILLTHSYTDLAWFHAAARTAGAICFPRGRIQFVAPSGDVCAQMQPQAFFYLLKSARRRACGNVDNAGALPTVPQENRTRRSGHLMCYQNRTT